MLSLRRQESHDRHQQLVDRYGTVWNEPDAGALLKAIAELWAEDVKIIESAKDRGHAAIETRITQAHEEFVKRQGSSSPTRTTPQATTTPSSSPPT